VDAIANFGLDMSPATADGMFKVGGVGGGDGFGGTQPLAKITPISSPEISNFTFINLFPTYLVKRTSEQKVTFLTLL
jgi:hypothetical protein